MLSVFSILLSSMEAVFEVAAIAFGICVVGFLFTCGSITAFKWRAKRFLVKVSDGIIQGFKEEGE